MGVLDPPAASPASLAKGIYRAGGFGRALVPIANRGRAGYNFNFGAISAGIVTSQTARIAHRALADCAELRLMYGNSPGGNPGANPITIRAALVIANNAYQVTFNGQTEITLEPDCWVVSDPVGADMAAGDTFYERTYVEVETLGQTWPTAVRMSASGDQYWDNTDISFATTTDGSLTAGVFTYAAATILGYAVSGKPPVLLLGDSIRLGTGDTANLEGLGGQDPGWAARKFANTRPFLQASIYGGRASGWTSGALGRNQGKFFSVCPYAISAYLSNDIFVGVAYASNVANITLIWKALQRRGVKTVQTTITPRTTSTDSYATVVNQTAINAGYETVRLQVNAWIRDGAPLDPTTKLAVAAGTAPALRAGQAGHPLIGWVELTDLVESARDSGKWKATYTTDGVHPNAVGYIAAAGAIDLSLLG